MAENCDKNTTTNTNARNVNDVSAIVKMCEKMIQEAVSRINDLRTAESERINQMFTSHKEYFDSKFIAQKDMSDAILRERDAKLVDKFESLATAINKAETATEKRFEGVNEFRATLSDQQKYISKTCIQSTHHWRKSKIVSANNQINIPIVVYIHTFYSINTRQL